MSHVTCHMSDFWELENLGTWELGNLGTWELGNLGTLELWNFGTLELWNLGTWELANLGPLELGNFKFWNFGYGNGSTLSQMAPNDPKWSKNTINSIGWLLKPGSTWFLYGLK